MAVGAILKPATGEWAVADERGVVLGEPIVPALHPVARLDDCLISVVVGFAPDRRAITWTILGRLLPRVQDLRSTGSTCCDLLAVATGTLDVYVGLDVKPWDVAAGAALVQAAGGVVRRIPLAGDHEAFLAGGAAVIEQVAAVAVECAREVAALDS
jgi:myo-inositol-1(or 4)-monophosphatase